MSDSPRPLTRPLFPETGAFTAISDSRFNRSANCCKALRNHLLQNINSAAGQPTTTVGQDTNIDPAISGLSAVSSAPVAPVAPLAPVAPTIDNAHAQAIAQSAEHSMEGQHEQPKRSGKRELSTSKRAAQNRAAQVC